MARNRTLLAAKYIPGGARPTPAPQGGGGGAPYYGLTSPLVQQLGNERGYSSTYGPFLPRPARTFTEGAFSPFSPILPVPVDAPAEGEGADGLPDPRLWEYPVGWNLPVGQPGTEGLKLVDFNTLRVIADSYSIARTCIERRKKEITGLDWDIVPTHEASKAYQGDRKANRDLGERIALAKKFFRQPDPDFFSFAEFLDAMLEEVFVYDALALFLRNKRGKGLGKGLLGSDLDCIELVSGPTIRPLVGLHGEKPRPPAPAYQQYLYGVPRSDYMTLITQRDVDEGRLAGAEVQAFSSDQLLYLRTVPRRWTPYGFSATEQAVLVILTGLQKQAFQLDYYREGTVPAVYISPGDVNMTPNQIRELQDALNAVAGDPAWHHKIIVLPPGSRTEPQRPVDLADQFDEIVMTEVAMCCVPGTQVITRSGLARIEEVAVGDYVLTHRGRWRPVTKVIRNPVYDQVRKIEANGLDILEVTGNHPVWAARYSQTRSHRQQYDETGWIAARDLTARDASYKGFDALTLPIPETGPAEARLRLSEHVKGRSWWVREQDEQLVHSNPRVKPLPAEVPMDAAFGRLLGFYMAEGSSTNGEVQWAFHEDEVAYQQQVIDDLNHVFGLIAKVEPQYGEDRGVKVTCHSALLAELLNCGTARTKRLPAWTWGGSPEFYASLLWAWVAGDGTIRSVNGVRGNPCWRGNTVSRDLAWQMRLVALACGQEASLRACNQTKGVIRGRKLNNADIIYAVQVTLGKGSLLGRRGTYRIDGPHLTSPVRSNELSDYDGEFVYNLEVEDDESYVTTGGTVHNCYDINPMDLGILPKVATTASPFATREMAQSQRAVRERTSLKPLLKFLCGIFDSILHRVCGQDDMKFTFEGLSETQNEATMSDLIVKQVQYGLRSVDEGRAELELPPWNLPETSGPVVFTQMGPVPFEMAPQLLAQQQMSAGGGNSSGSGKRTRATSTTGRGDQYGGPGVPRHGKPVAAPASNRLSSDVPPERGRAGTPAHDAARGALSAGSSKPGGGAPSDNARGKAVQAELESLARHLRKGREVGTWEARHIPGSVMAMITEDLGKGLSVDEVVKEAASTVVLGEDAYEWVAGADLPKGEGRQRQWPGWEHDLGLIGAYTEIIRRAFSRAEGKAGKLRQEVARGIVSVSASQFRDMLESITEQEMQAVLEPLAREAWHLGYAAAESLVTGAEVSWGKWPSGDPRSARRMRYREGLEAFLATEMRHWAAAIGRTGLKDAARRAEMIARTEAGRAQWAAAMQCYRDSGVERKHLLVAESACALCDGDAADGNIGLDEAFSSGNVDEPVHVQCRCAVAPAGVNVTPPQAHLGKSEKEKEGEIAAFLLLRTRNADGKKRYLLQKRSDEVKNGGTWGLPGGSGHTGESPWQTAVREAREEAGELPDLTVRGVLTRFKKGKAFYVFICDCAMFEPGGGKTADEAAGWGWFSRKEVEGLDLQPNFAKEWDEYMEDVLGKALRSVLVSGQEIYPADSDEDDEDPPGGGGGRYPHPHGPDGEEVAPGGRAGVEPPRWDGDETKPYVDMPSGPGGAAGRTGRVPPAGGTDRHVADGSVKKPRPEDDEEMPNGQAVSSEFVRGRPPNAIGKGADDFSDPSPVEAEHVYVQMAVNFPAKSIEWVRRARWIGPVWIPWDRVDTDDEESWAASHQPGKVDEFARVIREHDGHVAPSVLVQEESSGKAFIVDGHHRALARRKLGQRVLAYVGMIDPRDRQAALETHASQLHHGSDPENK